MKFELKMPDLSATDSPIKVLRWLVDVGELVDRGQPILEVETDKATMEVEALGTIRPFPQGTDHENSFARCTGPVLPGP